MYALQWACQAQKQHLMCRVLVDPVEESVVAKIANDLYSGGKTQLELLQNWTRGVQALQKSGLNLSDTKSIIAPKSTTILGWIWQLGTIKANPHRISILYQVTVRHVAEAAILPPDFSSRNAPDCEDSACQICTFVQLPKIQLLDIFLQKTFLNGFKNFRLQTGMPGYQSKQFARTYCVHMLTCAKGPDRQKTHKCKGH
ncbi:unnamed protein product [Mytilus coruscus]|uniref:Uncharacterized protein n=1 Tax=Mytilus coruscus TaxID=42192 RepID=A0A6J8F4U7_MYTCO|nr:unnamed protein product [Mytilus coruscus]